MILRAATWAVNALAHLAEKAVMAFPQTTHNPAADICPCGDVDAHQHIQIGDET